MADKGHKVDWRPQLDLDVFVEKDGILIPNMREFLIDAEEDMPGPDLRFTPDEANEFHKMLGAALEVWGKEYWA